MSILRKTSMAILAGLFITGISAAQEKKIKRSDLPPTVEKTVAEVSKGATIKGFSEETKKGKTTYEVEMVVNGHAKDMACPPPLLNARQTDIRLDNGVAFVFHTSE